MTPGCQQLRLTSLNRDRPRGLLVKSRKLREDVAQAKGADMKNCDGRDKCRPFRPTQHNKLDQPACARLLSASMPADLLGGVLQDGSHCIGACRRCGQVDGQADGMHYSAGRCGWQT